MDFWGILFALVARTLVFQLFSMPSGSMIPTLEVGDTFVASKYAYGYSRFSLPPFLSEMFFLLPAGRLLSFAPKRCLLYTSDAADE